MSTDGQEKPKNKGGRPTDYRAEYAEQASKLCELGATTAQLADFFDVAISTICLWMVKHPKFSEAIKVPKGKADECVEQSLYRRAMGYEHDEVDIRVVNNEIVETHIRKYYPPDPTAMIFWLKNRKPTEWREKTIQEVTGAGEQPLKFSIAIDRVNSVESAE